MRVWSGSYAHSDLRKFYCSVGAMALANMIEIHLVYEKGMSDDSDFMA